jgi:hypothetical protein
MPERRAQEVLIWQYLRQLRRTDLEFLSHDISLDTLRNAAPVCGLKRSHHPPAPAPICRLGYRISMSSGGSWALPPLGDGVEAPEEGGDDILGDYLVSRRTV